MKKLARCLILAAMVAVAMPAWSQTSSTTGQSPQGNSANAGGPSKPGAWITGKQVRSDGHAIRHDTARSLPEQPER